MGETCALVGIISGMKSSYKNRVRNKVFFPPDMYRLIVCNFKLGLRLRNSTGQAGRTICAQQLAEHIVSKSTAFCQQLLHITIV
jgi:hypothetical protein